MRQAMLVAAVLAAFLLAGACSPDGQTNSGLTAEDVLRLTGEKPPPDDDPATIQDDSNFEWRGIRPRMRDNIPAQPNSEQNPYPKRYKDGWNQKRIGPATGPITAPDKKFRESEPGIPPTLP